MRQKQVIYERQHTSVRDSQSPIDEGNEVILPTSVNESNVTFTITFKF